MEKLLLSNKLKNVFWPLIRLLNTHTHSLFQASLLMSLWQVPSFWRLSPFGTRHSGVPQWCHTLALLPLAPLLLLTFQSFLTSSFMMMMMMSASAAAIRPSSHPLCHVSRQIWRWALCSCLSQCLSPSSARSHPLSSPDIKSTTIRLLVNLWWPRHLTAELHQRLKNTESKWGCNGSGVGPWPLIELKDMGNTERKEKRDGERRTEKRRTSKGWRDTQG